MSKNSLEQALKKARENGIRMQELGNTSSRIGLQYEAHMTLYNVAAASGDEDTMAKERETLHSLLDHLLDNGAQIGIGQRELQNIMNSVD